MDLTEKASWREIIKRRFGPDHDRPCNKPTTLTCAMWDCQAANECQHQPVAAAIRSMGEKGE